MTTSEERREAIKKAMIPGLRAGGVTAVQAAITINATRSTQ